MSGTNEPALDYLRVVRGAVEYYRLRLQEKRHVDQQDHVPRAASGIANTDYATLRL